MLFKGRLRLPNDPGEGIPIDLEIEDVFLSLESAGEDFGEWRLDDVEIKRLFSNQFALQLDGEEMVFIADDALGFAYTGLSAIEDVKSRLSKRKIFKARKPKKKSIGGRGAFEPEDESEASDVEQPQAPPAPDVPMPEVVPFFPESSPSFADSVAESAVVDDSIAPVAPRPIEIADDVPEPQASPPRVAPEPVAPSPSTAEPQPTPEAEPPPAAQPVSAEVFEEDDELVIEDVSAYGYVPVASVPVEQRPLEPEPAEDDIEIEDAAPATGAVLREVHPLGEPAPAAPSEPQAPAHPPLDQPVAAQTGPAADSTPVVPERETSPATQPQAAEPAAPHGDSSFFSQWSSNGHAQTEPEAEPEPDLAGEEESVGSQTQKSGRHARSSEKSRSSRFGRKKSREPEAHEHSYESSKTVGGITRRVCAICGHVSFAGEDVYQDW